MRSNLYARILLVLGSALSLMACGGSGGGSVPGVSITAGQTIRVRQGESATLDVSIERTGGFAGAVEVAVVGLPAGVAADPVTVAAGAWEAALTIESAPSAAQAGPVSITVRASAVEDASLTGETASDLYVAGAPGASDTSLAGDGDVEIEMIAGRYPAPFEAAVDASGRLVVAGAVQGEEPWVGFVLRVLPDGSLDEEFGDAGIVTGFGLPDSACQSVALAGDGILAACITYDSVAMTVTRYLRKLDANGDVDPVFGTGGDATIPSEFRFVTPVGEGSLVYGYELLQAYGPTGDPDPFYTLPEPPPFATMSALKVDSEERVLVGALEQAGPFRIARLAEVGPPESVAFDLDPNFGDGGELTFPMPVGHEYARIDQIATAPEGSGFALGSAELVGGTYYQNRVALLGFTSEGEPDPGFGLDGAVEVVASGLAGFLLRQADGKLVVGYGVASEDGSTIDYEIARFETDGDADSSFGPGGVQDVTFSFPSAVAIDLAGGRLYLLDPTVGALTIRRIWL